MVVTMHPRRVENDLHGIRLGIASLRNAKPVTSPSLSLTHTHSLSRSLELVLTKSLDGISAVLMMVFCRTLDSVLPSS